MRMSSFKSWEILAPNVRRPVWDMEGDIDITDIHDVHMGQILKKLC